MARFGRLAFAPLSSLLLSLLFLLLADSCLGKDGEFVLLDPAGDDGGDRDPGGYKGTVSEHSQLVSVHPPIQTQGELVCKFSIVHRHNEERVPFEISIQDQDKGLGELRTKELLNCEERKHYEFLIEAISCSGTFSERVRVSVEVEDVNEFSPEWTSESLRVTVNEDELRDDLARLEATDQDCSADFGAICRYNIETENQPFEISTNGILRNTRPLNYTDSHSYVLSVVAEDCGGKKSAPLLVVVEVKQPCHTGWTGLSSHINYIPSTGPQPLFPQAALSLCPDDSCPAQNLEATLHLETKHIGKGCDRDTYNLASQRRLCGANEEALDLFELGLDQEDLSGQGDQNGLLRDKGVASDQSIVRFDGSSGLDITEKLQQQENFPGDKFTVATWMKHGVKPESFDKHRKEHIICKADDQTKNRHHMALFVRNCKLVLLLRREYVEGQENTFRPAEWRWQLPQVCDNDWHHYAVSVRLAEDGAGVGVGVDLVVDGDRWLDEKDNPEIIDDWPLHVVAEDIGTKTTVGACWQGSESRFRHEFEGYLAGLSFLPNRNENVEVLRCLHECSESLQVPATSALAPGMEMITDNKGSRVIVDGPSATDLATLVQQVAYLNTREFPSPGRRVVSLRTKITCQRNFASKDADANSASDANSLGEDDERILHLSEQKAVVEVITVPEPKIEVTGTQEISREYDDFKLGVRIFADVHIVMTTGSDSNGEPVNGIENRLDQCSVSVTPGLNSDHEHFDVPEDLLRSLSIVGKVSSDGAVFTGAEMIYNYERLLRQVTYTNMKPAYYLNRQFKIVCSEMNRRFVSNEYSQTLNVIHPSLPASPEETGKDTDNSKSNEASSSKMSSSRHFVQPKVAHFQVDSHHVDQLDFERRHFVNGISIEQSHNNVVAVVAVVCVGFLLVLLILGIIRLRARSDGGAAGQAGGGGQGGDMQAEVEMAWDDSALNITVNPLQEVPSSKKSLADADGLDVVTTLRENPCSDHYDSLSEDDEDDDDEDEDDENSYDDEDEDEDDEDDDVSTVCLGRGDDEEVGRVMIRRGGGGAAEQPLEWDDQDI